MTRLLEDRIAIVTGGAQGLGDRRRAGLGASALPAIGGRGLPCGGRGSQSRAG